MSRLVLRVAFGLSLLAAALSLGTEAIASGLGLAITPPVALNTNAVADAGRDGPPSIATDRLGHWIAVWESNDTLNGTIGDDEDILFSCSTDNGGTWTAPSPLNNDASTDTAYDYAPKIVTNGKGHWIVVWQGANRFGPSDYDLAISHSMDNGLTWSDPAFLNTSALTDVGQDYAVALQTDGQGTWTAVWTVMTTVVFSEYDIFVASSTDDGFTWSEPVSLARPGAANPGAHWAPSIATDREGTWIAVWYYGDYDGSLGGDGDILLARSLDNGATWIAPTPLYADAATDNRTDNGPKIASRGGNDWIVAWSYVPVDPNGSTIGDSDLLFSSSSDDGMTWTLPAHPNPNATFDTGYDIVNTVDADGQGNYIVSWYSTDTLAGTIGTDYDLLVSRSTNDGAIWSPPVPLNTTAATDTGHDVAESIASDGQGNWVSVWLFSPATGCPGPMGTDEDLLFARLTEDCNGNGIADNQDVLSGGSPDCNANNLPDECDIAFGASADINADSIPDECQSCCQGCDDGNPNTRDGCVDGLCVHTPALYGDIYPCGGDGMIDVDDLITFLNAFASGGQSPCPAR